MRRAHIVPLSWQAIAVLEELHDITGRSRSCSPAKAKRAF